MATYARSLRVDFARGIALLVLLSDHIHGNNLRDYTPQSMGLSDMSEVFVFLSGYSCGLSNARRFDADGKLYSVNRAIWRALQLYIVNIVMTVVALILFVLLDGFVQPSFMGIRWSVGLVRQYPSSTLLEVETLRLQVVQCFVLVLYCMLVIACPAIMMGFKHAPKLTMLCSFVLYCLTQFYPGTIRLYEPWQSAVLFNPFAWQFLFVIAFGLALCKANGRLPSRPNWKVVCLAIVCVIVCVDCRRRYELFGGLWADKQLLGPVRIVHYLFCALIGWWAIPQPCILIGARIAQPIIVCGRYPLVGYCAGGLIGILCEALLTVGNRTSFMQVTVNLSGWCGCLITTEIWRRTFRGRRQLLASRCGNEA